MIAIDKYAYHSKLSHIKAADKFFLTALPLCICLFASSNVVSVVTLITMCFATLVLGGFSGIQYIKILFIPSNFLAIGVITIIVNKLRPDSLDTLLSLRIFGDFYGITVQSFKTGITLYFKSLAAVSCLYFFSLNTPMNSTFNYLRRLHLPIILIELMELIYRFIFIVGNEAYKIHIAQSARLGYSKFTTSLKSLAELVSTVFIKSLSRVERANLALESRGFDGNFNYLIEEEEDSKILKVIGVLMSVVLLVIAMIERLIR